MLSRTFVTALLVLPMLTTTLASREAEACSPPVGFWLERVYPAADAVDVPTDGVIVLVGVGYDLDAAQVSVMLGDVAVPGELTQSDTDHYVWNSAQPLAADTVYAVHIETGTLDDVGEDSVLDLEFTTGSAPAPALASAALASAVVEGFEQDLQECVMPGSAAGDCVDCYEYEVVGVEQRMRLIAAIEAPTGPFVGFHEGRVAYGPNPETLDLAASMYAAAGGGPMVHTIDLGLAGTWPSEQVCARAEVQGPIGPAVEGEVSCVDISEINVEPIVAPTTGDSEDSGDSESAGDSESSGDDSGGLDDKGEGCGCRSEGEAGWSGLLVLLGLAGLRRRRV